jgi:glycosyltransferase involved in cell wall biosynthesis
MALIGRWQREDRAGINDFDGMSAPGMNGYLRRVDILIEGAVIDGAICHFALSRQLRKSGIASSVLGLRGESGLPDNFELVDASSIKRADWWRARNAHAVIAYGICLSSEVANAIRKAGVRLIVELDTAGDFSPRKWPMRARAAMVDQRHSLLTAVRVHGHWLRQVLQGWRAIEDRCVELIRLADEVIVPSFEARQNLLRILVSNRAADQFGKVGVLPFAVRDEFTQGVKPPAKEKLIVVASRLDSQQKDPLLMARVLTRFLAANSEYEVFIFCRGECPAIRAFAASHPQVVFQTNAPRSEVRSALLRARIMLYTSRFETVPIGGLEALCCGCTIVGPPLPGIRELAQGGRFGSTSKRRTARSLVAALNGECGRWSGERNPADIATYWQPRVSLGTVAKQWLNLVFGQRLSAGLEEMHGAI